jgi:N-acyl-D-amino-acid deacylase
MGFAFFVLPLHAAAPPHAVEAAVQKGLRRLQEGAANYTTNRQCFSCHHQALTLVALRSARDRRVLLNSKANKKQVEFTLSTFKPNRKRIAEGYGVAGGNTMAAYALFALEAAGHASDATTEALVHYLVNRQRKDGSWPALSKRPPSEGSPFTTNALALRALKFYGPKPKGESTDFSEAVAAALDRGKAWLKKSKPVDTEDQVFQLRALVTAEAEPEVVSKARDALAKKQLADGGWAQLPDKPSDAYATGAALMALREAGMPTDSAVYLKGVRFLLRNRGPRGAWLVTSRSRPVQVYFDNGDPGGKNQFISFAATGWAVLALLETLPKVEK